MPIEVELPDGTIAEFPDGTDNATMKQALAKYTQRTASAAPEKGDVGRFAKPEIMDAVPPEPPGMIEDVANSAGAGLVRGAAGLVGLPGTVETLGRMGISSGGNQSPMSDGTREDRQPSLMDQIAARTQNPLFQQGLGMFLAASQGKDLNEGLTAGSNRAKSMQDVMMRNLALQKQAAAQARIKEMMNNPATMGQVPPALIEIARATGDASPVVKYLTAKHSSNGDTPAIKEYRYAVDNGMFKGTFPEWVATKRSTSAEFGKSPIYGTNNKGETVILQSSSAGGLKQAELPPGVKIPSGVDRVDAGTHFVLLNKRDGQYVGTIPKQIAEAETQKVVGEARGKAQVDLPRLQNTLALIEKYVGDVRSDPNLPNVVGWPANVPTIRPESRATESRVAQLQGKAFLQAFQDLKGAGTITEREGAAASAALSRIAELRQDPASYARALDDFMSEVRQLVELARQRASGGQPQAAWQAGQSGGSFAQPTRRKYNAETGGLD